MNCEGHLVDSDVLQSNYSVVDMTATTPELSLLIDTLQDNGSFGEIIVNDSGEVTVGQNAGIVKISADKKVQKHSASLGEGKTFSNITQRDTDVFAWEIYSDKLEKTALSNLATMSYPIPILGNFPEVEHFEVENVEYAVVRVNNRLFILLTSNMQEVAQLYVPNADTDSILSSITTFERNDEPHVAMWLSDVLVILKQQGSSFSVVQSAELPKQDITPYAPALIMSVAQTIDDTKVIMIRESHHTEQRDFEATFERLTYSLNNQTFSTELSRTRRFDTSHQNGLDYCLRHNSESGRTLAYTINTIIDVVSPYIEDDRLRPARVVAIDMQSGDKVWSSDLLIGDGREGTQRLNIACNSESTDHPLVFATLKTLYITH